MDLDKEEKENGPLTPRRRRLLIKRKNIDPEFATLEPTITRWEQQKTINNNNNTFIDSNSPSVIDSRYALSNIDYNVSPVLTIGSPKPQRPFLHHINYPKLRKTSMSLMERLKASTTASNNSNHNDIINNNNDSNLISTNSNHNNDNKNSTRLFDIESFNVLPTQSIATHNNNNDMHEEGENENEEEEELDQEDYNPYVASSPTTAFTSTDDMNNDCNIDLPSYSTSFVSSIGEEEQKDLFKPNSSQTTSSIMNDDVDGLGKNELVVRISPVSSDMSLKSRSTASTFGYSASPPISQLSSPALPPLTFNNKSTYQNTDNNCDADCINDGYENNSIATDDQQRLSYCDDHYENEISLPSPPFNNKDIESMDLYREEKEGSQLSHNSNENMDYMNQFIQEKDENEEVDEEGSQSSVSNNGNIESMEVTRQEKHKVEDKKRKNAIRIGDQQPLFYHGDYRDEALPYLEEDAVLLNGDEDQLIKNQDDNPKHSDSKRKESTKKGKGDNDKKGSSKKDKGNIYSNKNKLKGNDLLVEQVIPISKRIQQLLKCNTISHPSHRISKLSTEKRQQLMKSWDISKSKKLPLFYQNSTTTLDTDPAIVKNRGLSSSTTATIKATKTPRKKLKNYNNEHIPSSSYEHDIPDTLSVLSSSFLTTSSSNSSNLSSLSEPIVHNAENKGTKKKEKNRDQHYMKHTVASSNQIKQKVIKQKQRSSLSPSGLTEGNIKQPTQLTGEEVEQNETLLEKCNNKINDKHEDNYNHHQQYKGKAMKIDSSNCNNNSNNNNIGTLSIYNHMTKDQVVLSPLPSPPTSSPSVIDNTSPSPPPPSSFPNKNDNNHNTTIILPFDTYHNKKSSRGRTNIISRSTFYNTHHPHNNKKKKKLNKNHSNHQKEKKENNGWTILV